MSNFWVNVFSTFGMISCFALVIVPEVLSGSLWPEEKSCSDAGCPTGYCDPDAEEDQCGDYCVCVPVNGPFGVCQVPTGG